MATADRAATGGLTAADHPFELDPDSDPEEPACRVCGGHGDFYADGWDHARVED